MKAFTYERADRRRGRAPAAAGRPGAKFIAGGTNLLDLMKLQVETPAHLVDISRLPLDRDRGRRDGGLRIGALVRNSDLAARPRACASAIRCWRRRCWPAPRRSCATRRRPAATCCSAPAATTSTTPSTPCNKRAPGSGCSALQGFNRIHAILGASDALHRHASVRHGRGDARARRRGRDRCGRAAAPRASRSPTSTACPATRRSIDTDLEPGELITAVDAAAAAAGRAGLSQGARPRLLRLRAGLGGRDRRMRTTARSARRAHRVRRRGAQAVARRWRPSRRWSACRRPTTPSPPPPTPCCKARAGHGHNDFKIPLARRTLRRAAPNATAGSAPWR